MFKVGDIVKFKDGESNFHEIIEVKSEEYIVIKSFKSKLHIGVIVMACNWVLDKSYYRKDKLLKLKQKLNE